MELERQEAGRIKDRITERQSKKGVKQEKAIEKSFVPHSKI